VIFQNFVSKEKVIKEKEKKKVQGVGLRVGV